MSALGGARDAEGVHRVQLLTTVDLDRFCAFLREVHVRVHSAAGVEVLASIPGAPSPLHERRELVGYITTWNALNPESQVRLEVQG